MSSVSRWDDCRFNSGVSCEQKDRCYCCGFNPDEHERRIVKIKTKILEEFVNNYAKRSL